MNAIFLLSLFTSTNYLVNIRIIIKNIAIYLLFEDYKFYLAAWHFNCNNSESFPKVQRQNRVQLNQYISMLLREHAVCSMSIQKWGIIILHDP